MSAPTPETTLADEAALRTRYRRPSAGVVDKQIDHVDDAAAGFLAATTLVVVATFGHDGADASPRGGPPGFVRPLDRQRIAFADLSGNNRLDTYTNLTERPEVGLLCVVPGLEETMRVNGRASVSVDPDVLAAVAFDERTPKVAVVVDVDECYIHCGKALRRAGVWDPATWRPKGERPEPAAILVQHAGVDLDPALLEAGLEQDYRDTLWVAGGDSA